VATETLLYALLAIVLFPGFAFLTVFALAGEWFDRFTYARFQNRVGPPWFQPLADVIKLCAKEDTVPDSADRTIFRFMPVLALSTTVTSILYIPIWKSAAVFSFTGDLVVVLYLLTVPTLTFFLGGWFSRSAYSLIGASRAITQLFAYEIPLLLALLSPAMLADSWSISEIAAYYNGHPLLMLVNVIGFGVALVSLLGKLERVPFDIPEAETEIVAGTFTEYGGRLFALFRLAVDIEMIVGGSLVAAVFLPFGYEVGTLVGVPGLDAPIGFVLYVVKVLLVVEVIAFLRTVMARLRIDQMVDFCWKYLAPLAFLQLVINLVVKGLI
jgi:NADH-quinone oxidoreductase subunit H